MKTEPTKKYQHRTCLCKFVVFILDWDDTLLCTSFLSALSFSDISHETKEMIKKLDDIVVKLINQAVSRGVMYIITNATKGWVQHSSKLYLFFYLVICQTRIACFPIRLSQLSPPAPHIVKCIPVITDVGKYKHLRAS